LDSFFDNIDKKKVHKKKKTKKKKSEAETGDVINEDQLEQ